MGQQKIKIENVDNDFGGCGKIFPFQFSSENLCHKFGDNSNEKLFSIFELTSENGM